MGVYENGNTAEIMELKKNQQSYFSKVCIILNIQGQGTGRKGWKDGPDGPQRRLSDCSEEGNRWRGRRDGLRGRQDRLMLEWEMEVSLSIHRSANWIRLSGRFKWELVTVFRKSWNSWRLFYSKTKHIHFLNFITGTVEIFTVHQCWSRGLTSYPYFWALMYKIGPCSIFPVVVHHGRGIEIQEIRICAMGLSRTVCWWTTRSMWTEEIWQ